MKNLVNRYIDLPKFNLNEQDLQPIGYINILYIF